jgi:hypothetical protein
MAWEHTAIFRGKMAVKLTWHAEGHSPLSWFNADAVVHGPVQALLAPEIFLCCLNGHVTQQELNLLQFSPRNMAQACA